MQSTIKMNNVITFNKQERKNNTKLKETDLNAKINLLE